MRLVTLAATTALLIGALAPVCARAHGFAGKRFFPSTLTFDDPFPADEFDLLVSHQPDTNEDGERADVTELDLEYAKRITPRFSVSLEAPYVHRNPAQGPDGNGFDNLAIGAKYLGVVDAEHEFVATPGLEVELGGTGSQHVGREPFSVISPTLYFGKGLGDLPSGGEYLRPLALTGAISYEVPTRGSEHQTFSSSFALLYDLHYLSSYVKDVGLPSVLRHAIPLVEAPLQFCVDKGCGGDLTATVNPGVILFNRLGQISAEAVIPVNDRSGRSIGVLLQLHMYLDDWFPHSLGKPLFN